MHLEDTKDKCFPGESSVLIDSLLSYCYASRQLVKLYLCFAKHKFTENFSSGLPVLKPLNSFQHFQQ